MFKQLTVITSLILFSPSAQGLSAKVHTSSGNFQIKLADGAAPNAVAQFVALAKVGFYTQNVAHKISKNYLVSFGVNPKRKDGTSGEYIKEPKQRTLKHDRAGIVSFVRRHRGTASSEFIITLKEAPIFDNRYLVFGEITSGLAIVRKISALPSRSGVPLKEIKILSITFDGPLGSIGRPETIAVPSEETISKMTKVVAQRVSKKISESESYGKVASVEFVDSVARGLSLQAFFEVKYLDKSTSHLDILGSLDNDDGVFELKQFQFRR